MAEEGLNKVLLIGRLTRDSELRYTSGGSAVLNFSLATSENYFDKSSNERKEKTEFHNIVLWGKRGESLSKFLMKGSRIHVEGKLSTRSWEAKDGGKRYTTEVVAMNIILLGSRAGGAGGGDEGPPPPSDDDYDDDIPF